MVREMPTTAYVEIQIDDDSISLSLISESGSGGAVIEDTERFEFDELESLAGEHSTLSLSRESANALEKGEQCATAEELLAEMEQVESKPESGDILVDENAPTWVSEDRVRVVEVLENVSADEYILDGPREGYGVAPLPSDATVADANPSYPSDDSVIIAHPLDANKEYAYPESRLTEE